MLILWHRGGSGPPYKGQPPKPCPGGKGIPVSFHSFRMFFKLTPVPSTGTEEQQPVWY